MAVTIKLKNASGSDPSASDLVVGEVALRTDTGKLFTKKDDNSVAEISGGIDDGDKGDITVSSSGAVFTIDNGVVTSAKIANDTIVNADINSSAAIDGSKISPAFTSDITGTGNLTLTSTDAGSSAAPELELYRNSSSPADADYLGQLKFTGESDDGSKEVYAKITGKIDDASSGTEDGIIEFAHRKAGSNVITGRFKSTELQLLNGTNLDVDGTITGNLTGNVTGNVSGSSGSCTGNAATATALETARTIAGVSFDGTANISLNNNAITNGAGYITTVADTTIAPSTIDMEDSEKIKLGTGDDLEIFHNGSASFINNITGDLKIISSSNLRLRSDSLIIQNNAESETLASFSANGAVELYFDNAKKAETVTGGFTVTGTCTATAFSGDGSALTGISAGATGGGSDEIFYENGQTVTTDYTITNGKNAMSAGPIEISSGVTVTVGSGETLTIV